MTCFYQDVAARCETEERAIKILEEVDLRPRRPAPPHLMYVELQTYAFYCSPIHNGVNTFYDSPGRAFVNDCVSPMIRLDSGVLVSMTANVKKCCTIEDFT